MEDYLSVPGYLPVRQAAMQLGLSEKRILQFILAKRLPSRKVSGRHLIPMGALDHFAPGPHGRVRTQPAPWRKYRAGAKVSLRHIVAPVLPGRTQDAQEYLAELAEQQAYCFAGTMQRFLFVDGSHLHLVLVWKSTEIDQEALARDVSTFMAATDDLVDWRQARDDTSEVVAHT